MVNCLCHRVFPFWEDWCVWHMHTSLQIVHKNSELLCVPVRVRRGLKSPLCWGWTYGLCILEKGTWDCSMMCAAQGWKLFNGAQCLGCWFSRAWKKWDVLNWVVSDTTYAVCLCYFTSWHRQEGSQTESGREGIKTLVWSWQDFSFESCSC